MSESFSSTELTLLRVFHQKDARAGDAVPTAVLTATVVLSGGAPVLNGAIETALLGLEFRGLIVPGPNPFSATSWMLTQLGDEVVNSSADTRKP